MIFPIPVSVGNFPNSNGLIPEMNVKVLNRRHYEQRLLPDIHVDSPERLQGGR